MDKIILIRMLSHTFNLVLTQGGRHLLSSGGQDCFELQCMKSLPSNTLHESGNTCNLKNARQPKLVPLNIVGWHHHQKFS